MSYKPEYVPKLSSNVLDTSAFDPDMNKNDIEFSVVPEESYTKINEKQDKFKEF